MKLEKFIRLLKENKVSRNKEIILFCGAGISKKAGLPSWPEFNNFFEEEKLNKKEFEGDKNILMIFWRNLLSKFRYTDNHARILRIAEGNYIDKIITANYDVMFEECIEKEFEYWLPKRELRQRGIKKNFLNKNKILLKIHGDVEQDKVKNINLGLSCGNKIEDSEEAWEKIFSQGKKKILWVIGYRGKNSDYAFKLIKNAVDSNKIEKVYWMHRGRTKSISDIDNVVKNIGKDNIELIKIDGASQALKKINEELFNETINDTNSEKEDSIDLKSIKRSYEIAKKTIGLLERIDYGIIENMHKSEDEFNGLLSSGDKLNESDTKLYVLRRYNSYTPILPRNNEDSKGGGYFLIHKGKGIVIDPGYDFLENFLQHKYDKKNDKFFRLNHINAIIITHAHNDHYGDFDSIQNMVYQYNKKIKLNKKLSKAFKCVLKISEVTDKEQRSYLINNIRSEIKLITEDDPKQKEAQVALELLEYYDKQCANEDKIKNIVDILSKYIQQFEREEKIEIDLFISRSAYKAINGLIPSSSNAFKSINILNPNDKRNWYGIEISAIKVKHQDLYGKDGAIGLKLKFNFKSGEDFTIGFTGDTGYFVGLEENYLECDVLVPHIGSIKPKELKIYEKKQLSFEKNDNIQEQLSEELNRRYLIPRIDDGDIETAFYGNHLGILGITTLIAATSSQSEKLKVVVISEYGEEMNSFRHEITGVLSEIFENLIILTGDIGLEIDFNKIKDNNFIIKETAKQVVTTTIEYKY